MKGHQDKNGLNETSKDKMSQDQTSFTEISNFNTNFHFKFQT